MGLYDQNPWLNPDTGSLGVAGDPATSRPQLPSPEQFAADYKWRNGVAGFQKGLLPGLIGLIAGADPTAIASAYNTLLTGAQGAEQGRISTNYYDQASGQGGAAPAQSMTPTSVPIGPNAGLIAAMGGQPAGGGDVLNAPRGGVAPGRGLIASMAAGAPSVAPPGVKVPVAGAGGYGPGQAMSMLQRSLGVPALASSAGPAMTALTKMIEMGKSVDGNGNIYSTPGALGTTTQDALAKLGISTAGVDANSQDSVNAARARSAAAIESAQKWAGVGPANATSDHAAGNTLATNLAKPEQIRENGAYVTPPQPVLTRDGWRVPAAPVGGTAGAGGAADGSPQSRGDSNVSVETLPDGTKTLTNSGTVREATQNNEKLYKDYEGLATANKGAEQNIKNAANAFQYFASGAGTEAGAEAAAWMKRAGIDPKAFNLADPAQVQIAKKAVVQAIFSQMSGIQNPALGEFQLAEKAAGQPDFQPDAVKAIFGTTLGKMALQDEFFQNMAQHRNEKGTMRGYDPSKFLLSADAQGYQQKAEQSLPWFKGETGAPAYTKLAAPPTGADIAATALKYNMTPNQVRAKLGLPALGGK